MDIEEIDVLIEKAQHEVDVLMDQRKKYLSNKMWTKKTKQQKVKPLEQAIMELRERIQKLEIIKDKKIPFYEKLPKDSAFYKHYMSVLSHARLQEATTKLIAEDKSMLINAAASIPNPLATASTKLTK